MNIYHSTSKQRRIKKVRAKLAGTADCPRLSVFRSHQHIYAQIINDQQRKTLSSASDFQLKSKSKNQIDIAGLVGKLVAEKAIKQKIKRVKFDRGPYNYHGRVKALAEAARQAGLQF